MSSWSGLPELKESHRQLGAARFWAMMAAVLGWIAVGVWLNMTVAGWPDAYGSSCHGRGCFFSNLWVSPGLWSGGWRERALFIWLWSMPALVAGAFVYAFVAKRGILSKSNPE